MRKFLSIALLSVLSATTFVSCESDDVIVNENSVYAKAFDIKNVNLQMISSTNYSITRQLPFNLIEMDMVLVYRMVSVGGSNGNVWEQIPTTYHFAGGAEYLDYVFEFNDNSITIDAYSNFNLAGDPLVTNQTFRVLMVPASQAKVAPVDYADYNAVVKHFNIKESQIQTVKN